jgi:hypothetical protein
LLVFLTGAFAVAWLVRLSAAVEPLGIDQGIFAAAG